ncbi:MAG: hypothetical protein HYZ50_12515 [Deltaproteobacteria bacterium]|nr:hypothetical protein [Deltaproteobacteria bacterium]
MPLLLRKIRKSRWNELIGASQISDEQLQNGPLTDLRERSGDELSVWDIAEDRGNLLRIVAALAGKLESFSPFDYLLFDRQLLVEVGIKWERTEGDSADAEANTSWHIDLKNLTDGKRLQLADSF